MTDTAIDAGGALEGRVGLVTGGTRGLGRRAALALARAGADVMIVGRTLETCEVAASEIAAETGRRIVPRACHVGRWEEVDGLADAVYEEFGRLDVLVNNAGMSPHYDDVAEVSEDLWRKVVDVNLTAPFRLTALVGKRMAAGHGGSIINISSVIAEHPAGDAIPYAAAKAGLNAITVGFARAFGPRVRVNAVVAGAFLTDVSKHWDMEAFDRHASAFALARAGEPEEIEGAILFLATSASSYATGSVLRVDGGYLPPPQR